MGSIQVLDHHFQSGDELEHHADTGKTLERIVTVALHGVDYRIGGGHFCVAGMMVGDDYIHAAGLGKGNFIVCGHARIRGDQKIDILIQKGPDSRQRQSVSFVMTAGNIVGYVCSQRRQIQI